MRPKPLPSRGDDLSRPRLDAIIDARHPLVQLAGLIDWARFDEAFGSLYAETGRPGLPTRLMVGLHLLKHMKGLSDEEVCAQWVENPYMQAFCGEAVFRHVLPLDRSSLTRWRTRIGADQLEELLAETIAAATRSEALPPERLERVTIDTSVQTKAVAHPTDSHLLLRGIEWLNRLAKRHGIRLRQSFLRLATRAKREVGRLVHTRGHAQAMRYVRRMRTWLGRLERDVGRKIAGDAALEAAFATARARIARLLAQRPEDPNKLYALHAPEVECIAKGKARVRYEFGVKLSLAVTNARAEGGQFVLGVRTLPGNPYDGHTLGSQAGRPDPGLRLTHARHLLTHDPARAAPAQRHRARDWAPEERRPGGAQSPVGRAWRRDQCHSGRGRPQPPAPCGLAQGFVRPSLGGSRGPA
jgi:transposase, IS5 family